MLQPMFWYRKIIRKSSLPSVVLKIKTTTVGTLSEALCQYRWGSWGELYASEPLRDAYAEYPEDLRSRYIVPQYLKDDETGEYRKEFIYIESSEEDGVPRKYYRWNEIIEENGNYRIKDAYLSKYEYKDTLTMKQDAGGYYVESRLKSGKDNPTPHIRKTLRDHPKSDGKTQ